MLRGQTSGAWRARAALAAGVALLAIALPAPMRSEDEGAQRGAIRIDSNGVHPEEFVVPAGEVAAWVNEQDQRAVISFPGETEEAFTCDDLRPNFHRDGSGRLVSLAIRSLHFQLPCPLRPGTYAYRVHLIRVPGPPGVPIVPQDQPNHPDQSFEGRLIVR